MPRMPRDVADYVRSLGLDAWMVGGAVRDELLGRPVKDTDFVVPGLGHRELADALAPHGKVEDLVVAGRHVGVRLYPRGQEARKLAPAGIEFAPPRIERSTGPGRHDFEIVADPSLPLEEDMRRRDFTVNAIARRLSTGEILDPLGGREDLERRKLRTTSAESFRDDPLRIVRGLRFVSELDLDPDDETLAQMKSSAGQVPHVSAERIGGGLAADGLGELSKLVLGARPAKALRLARDTGVLVQVLPEYAPAVGYRQRSDRQHLTLDEHLFAVVQATADAGAELRVRLAALLHDLGKPEAERAGGDHAELGARLAAEALARLRYPTRLRAQVRAIVRAHAFDLRGDVDALRARRFLHVHGDELAFDLVAHKRADLRDKNVPLEELEALDRFERLLEEERTSPHRLAELAVDGSDLLAAGFQEGPALGRALERLLERVVDDPSLNTRERLLEEAESLR
jgi:tRNA nucleotidyltransferase (CCA-adding enzyme)